MRALLWTRSRCQVSRTVESTFFHFTILQMLRVRIVVTKLLPEDSLLLKNVLKEAKAIRHSRVEKSFQHGEKVRKVIGKNHSLENFKIWNIFRAIYLNDRSPVCNLKSIKTVSECITGPFSLRVCALANSVFSNNMKLNQFNVQLIKLHIIYRRQKFANTVFEILPELAEEIRKNEVNEP